MSNELMEILRDSVSIPNLAKPELIVPSDNGPANIHDRIAGLQAEAKELKKAGKLMTARKKLNEAAHFRRLVKKIEKQAKNLGK